MNYEEKYREALQAVNELKKQINQSDDGIQKWADKYFPKLKDSEDEKVRKSLLKFLHGLGEWEYPSTKVYKMWLAWLEKQGEQKSVAKIEPKFKVGDYLVNDYCKGKVIELTDDAYLLDTGQGIPFSYEHNAHLWTIQDAKDGDLIYVSTGKKGIQAIFYRFDSDIIYFHCYLCTDFTQGGYMPIGDVELVYPLQKTHYKRFFEKMHEAGYEWDAEKKELRKVEQNSAWSEEDEKILNMIISDYIAASKSFCGYQGKLDWLKLIKERVQSQPKQEWKPSEEQMKSLSLATQCVYAEEDIKNLESLYTDLKKI